MKLNWNEIWEGWKNDLFPARELKELIRQTQEERLAICKGCPFNSTPNRITLFSTCKSCGCPLKKKAACLHCKCPEGKWSPALNEEHSQQINNQLNKENEPS